MKQKYIAMRSITLWQRAELDAPTFAAALKQSRSRHTKWVTTAEEDWEPVIIDARGFARKSIMEAELTVKKLMEKSNGR